MRKKIEQHFELFCQYSNHEFSEELRKISDILELYPNMLDWVFADLCSTQNLRGAKGMSAEMVLRAAILKQQRGWTYKELEFHLADSQACRAFVRIPYGITFRDSTLQENIKKISHRTWEKINEVLINYACKMKIEDGKTIRIDSTVVETNIH